MIREALRHYPFVGLSLLALVLFVAAWVRVLTRTLTTPRGDIHRDAMLPLEER